MAFRFRLQSVLEHRRHKEELAQAELAKRMKAEHDCLKQLEWISEEVTTRREQLAQRSAKGMPAHEYALAGDYATTLRIQQMRQASRLGLLNAETELARGKLVIATRDRKALDVLRERHLREYLDNERRLEQIALDEVAVRNYSRKNSQ